MGWDEMGVCVVCVVCLVGILALGGFGQHSELVSWRGCVVPERGIGIIGRRRNGRSVAGPGQTVQSDYGLHGMHSIAWLRSQATRNVSRLRVGLPRG